MFNCKRPAVFKKKNFLTEIIAITITEIAIYRILEMQLKLLQIMVIMFLGWEK